jgi:biopolymer transport protein ExbB
MWAQIETILIRGGIMMIPLGVCSFLVLLITLERIFILQKKRLVSEQSVQKWKTWFAEGGERGRFPTNVGPSLVSLIMAKIIQLLPLSKSRLEERLGDLARIEKHRLERGLVILDTIAGIAPLFGLLGTALGMVEVFSRLSLVDEAKMSALSSGISQALFTTVAGLMIGIPSLIAFNLFTRRIDSLMITVEEQINLLVDTFFDKIIEG